MARSPRALAGVAVAAAANVAVHRYLPNRSHVPTNLATAGVLIALARRDGAGWNDLGLGLARAAPGARAGVLVAAPVVGVVALGVALPATRRWFVDARVADATPGEVAYQTLVRIPLGTALAEELMFRGALPALLGGTPVVGDAATAALFGVWHLLPTIDQMQTHDAGSRVRDRAHRQVGAVLGVVGATAGAGVLFAWLRRRTGSVTAPIVVHAALNVAAYLGGRAAARYSASTRSRMPSTPEPCSVSPPSTTRF